MSKKNILPDDFDEVNGYSRRHLSQLIRRRMMQKDHGDLSKYSRKRKHRKDNGEEDWK
jgi:hypothetical protein